MSQQTAKLACTCGNDSTVLLQITNDGTYGGQLQTSEGNYQIEAIYEREGIWDPSTTSQGSSVSACPQDRRCIDTR